jgi:hypothetical protein
VSGAQGFPFRLVTDDGTDRIINGPRADIGHRPIAMCKLYPLAPEARVGDTWNLTLWVEPQGTEVGPLQARTGAAGELLTRAGGAVQIVKREDLEDQNGKWLFGQTNGETTRLYFDWAEKAFKTSPTAPLDVSRFRHVSVAMHVGTNLAAGNPTVDGLKLVVQPRIGPKATSLATGTTWESPSLSADAVATINSQSFTTAGMPFMELALVADNFGNWDGTTTQGTPIVHLLEVTVH